MQINEDPLKEKGEDSLFRACYITRELTTATCNVQRLKGRQNSGKAL